MRLFAIAAAVACLPHSIVVAQGPFAPLSVVVPDKATASLLPALPNGSRLGVLLRNENESEEVVHSRAFKLRFATHFVYCSECESPLSAIYRERLQNHGAVVIDLRTLSRAELAILLKPRARLRRQHSDGLPLANLFQQH